MSWLSTSRLRRRRRTLRMVCPRLPPRRQSQRQQVSLLVGANQIKNENNKREENATNEGAEMRRFIRIVALGAALVVSGSAFAQQYPGKPVKIIVPFPPAGVTDIVGRLVAQKLSDKLGEQFYIENIAGAGGNLGMGQAARSPGDGYTILFASSSIVVNPTLYSKVPFDIDKDFVPVTKAGATPNSCQINPNFPAPTMPPLIHLTTQQPAKPRPPP